MNNEILAIIDAEIAKLQQARALLVNTPDALADGKTGRGRPKGSTQVAETAPAKRGMSDEGRAKVAEAQRKRHAAKKKAARKAAKEPAQTEQTEQTEQVEPAAE